MQAVLLVPTGQGMGLTSAALGLLRSLDYLGVKAGFFKPFLESESTLSTGTTEAMDRSSLLIERTLRLSSPPSISLQLAEQMMGDNLLDELLERVVAQFQSTQNDATFMVVEGVVPQPDHPYAMQLNAALAQALDARVILVSTADVNQAAELADHLDMYARPFGGVESERTLGVLLMRVTGLDATSVFQSTDPLPHSHSLRASRTDLIRQLQECSPLIGSERFALLGMVPFSKTLSVPRTHDVAESIGAIWLNRGDSLHRRVQSTTLCARTVANVTRAFRPGSLIVTPGDRDDILVAAALSSLSGTPLAGILMTGGYLPGEAILDLCRPALRTGLPVLSVQSDSFETVLRLGKFSNEIPPDDSERAEQVTSYVSEFIDMDWLSKLVKQQHSNRLSPSAFRHRLVKEAQRVRQRIVLPEGSEPRTVQAAILCQNRGIADCILLARREEVEAVAAARGLTLPPALQIVDPEPIRQRYIAPMVERRKGKLTEPMAEEQLQDTVVLGTMMLALDEVDGLVSGAIHTTANTVRPAFQLIKTAPGYSLVSSVFFMLLPEQVVVYGDCAINPDPNATELAEIAIQSAESALAFGIEPRVAMISYSTGESGTGSDVDKVREATRIARERRPDLMIDGPLQYDAAAIESVGKQKAPDSQVAGRATVFIFPDLNTGNTTYKAVQRSANVVSVGPMLQGLNKPVNDLSRGALVEDIVYTIALTALQASQKHAPAP